MLGEVKAAALPPPMGADGAREDGEGGNGMHWMEAIQRLQEGCVAPRSAHIKDEDCQVQQVFLEHPLLKRRKGEDRWMTSGGRKGAMVRWATPQVGVLKRYGRVVRSLHVPLKYAQYSLQARQRGRDGQLETVDIKDKSLWVVQPLDNSCTAPNVLSAPNAGPHQAVVDVCAGPRKGKFVSFLSIADSAEGGMELGVVVSKGCGVTLQSRQGDFAEWHRRANGEPPFEEGDVVGFRRGCITRNTQDCSALGIVSRKAVVEGTTPAAAERHLFDTVAYCGVVPVKLSTRPAAPGLGYNCSCSTPSVGQLLIPSGRNDGTAVLASASDSIWRVGILLDDPEDPTAAEASCSQAGYRLATALVVAPAETVRPGSRPMHLLRRLAMLAVWLLATITVAIFLFNRMQVPPSAPISQQDDDQYMIDMDQLLRKCPVEVQTCLDTDGCHAALNVARRNRPSFEQYGSGTKEVQDIVTCVARSCTSKLPKEYIEAWGCPTNVCDVNQLWNNLPRGYLTQVNWSPESVQSPFVTVQQLGLRCRVEDGYTYTDDNSDANWHPPVVAACLHDHGNFTNLTGCILAKEVQAPYATIDELSSIVRGK